jgi:hypothetical protein
MNKVVLSRETRRDLFRLLSRASLARHLACAASEHGWADRVAFYREENRRYLREARALVSVDDREVCANGPVQVSETAAFRRLRVLCVLGNGAAGVSRLLDVPARPDLPTGSLLVHRSECGQAGPVRLRLHRPALIGGAV